MLSSQRQDNYYCLRIKRFREKPFILNVTLNFILHSYEFHVCFIWRLICLIDVSKFEDIISWNIKWQLKKKYQHSRFNLKVQLEDLILTKYLLYGTYNSFWNVIRVFSHMEAYYDQLKRKEYGTALAWVCTFLIVNVNTKLWLYAKKSYPLIELIVYLTNLRT